LQIILHREMIQKCYKFESFPCEGLFATQLESFFNLSNSSMKKLSSCVANNPSQGNDSNL